SSASSDGKWLVVTIRVPEAVGSNVNDMRIAGKPSSGSPSSSVNASSTSKEVGASMRKNSHDPDDRSPCGLVIEYSALPPTVWSKVRKVAGQPGGPQNRSSWRGSL